MSDTTGDAMSGGEERFPFATPEGSDASMFIQWKGTDVCLDFYCPCGVQSYFDGYFAYHLRCPACGAVYEMGTQVIVKRVEGDRPSVQDLLVDHPGFREERRP